MKKELSRFWRDWYLYVVSRLKIGAPDKTFLFRCQMGVGLAESAYVEIGSEY